jgi:hypothetical protein
MLDVHPPHQAAHTWKDFFIHIFTIVIGLLIAIGLEQTVEHFHHQHQAHFLEDSLQQETRKNRAILDADIDIMVHVHQVEEQNKASLESTLASHGKFPFEYIDYDPAPDWTPPTNAVWASARDNGTLSLLPPAQASYLSRLDFSTGTTIETSHQVFDARYRVLALVHLHAGTAQLTPAERDSLLLAISNYEETADHARMVMEKSQHALGLNRADTP